MHLTFTEILEQQKIWRTDLLFDLTQDWLEDEQKRTMETQLLLLNQSISSLESIDIRGGQIFSSTIPK